VLGAVAALFVGLLHADVPEAQARAATFSALVLCCLVLIIANRNFSGNLVTALRRPNKALWRVVASTTGMLAVVLLIAPLRRLFNFEMPTPVLLCEAVAVGLGVLLLLEVFKPIALRMQHGQTPAQVQV
jgi:Ca2+-transporting ATPase